MARISVFEYTTGTSPLHRLDVRFKFAALLMLNLAVARSDARGLLILTVLILPCLLILRIQFRALISELRLFLILLLFVFIARSLSGSGSPLFPAWQSGITVEGMKTGGLICWRLGHIVLLGLLFIRTSRTGEIKAAVYRFFRWIPGFPAHRVGLMISLMFRFIPMIFQLNGEISDAQHARAVTLRRNPVYRIRYQVVPLLENVFRKADEMILAMEARCYSDARTEPEFSALPNDWMMLLGAGLITLLMLVV